MLRLQRSIPCFVYNVQSHASFTTWKSGHLWPRWLKGRKEASFSLVRPKGPVGLNSNAALKSRSSTQVRTADPVSFITRELATRELQLQFVLFARPACRSTPAN